MKNQPDHSTVPMPANGATRRHYYTLTVLACLFALMSACNANRVASSKGQPLRLNVGDIQELTMTTRTDTTWQLTATSDNQEVVDVSRKSGVGGGNGMNPTATGEAVFLLKGVTIGTANVVFSEKQKGTDGSGRVKKTYRVTVVSK